MPQNFEPVTFNRDCEVTQIPSGTKMTLSKGTQGRITQSLGGAYTIVTDQGVMVSLAARDLDAIGKDAAAKPSEPAAQVPQGPLTPEEIEKKVWDQLRTCYDPEIPHNIVDLGLIYECRLSPATEGEGQPSDKLKAVPSGVEGRRVDIKMSLTAQGCGMGDWLKQDVAQKVKTIPGVKEVNVEVVFDPPWTPERMSPVLKRYLNM